MFKRDTDYTRRQIHEKLGGSMQSYLPTDHGRVVCACLRTEINPEAPNVVLVGNGKGIRAAGDILASQREPIPVFIKRSTNQWAYRGHFQVLRSSQRSADIRPHALAASRFDITRVIFLQPAERVIDSHSASCVYTIRHSKYLTAACASGGKGEFLENKAWASGSRIFREARKSHERVPILFAPANSDSSSCGFISYWALIDEIALTPRGTRIKFSALQPLSKKHRPSSLKKLSDGKRLADNYRWSYVLCKTPAFILSAVADAIRTESLPDIEAEEISARQGALPVLADVEAQLSAEVAESTQLNSAERLRRLSSAPKIPESFEVTTTVYRRNPDVIAATLRRAQGRCEKCGKSAPFLRKSDGMAYLEVHHWRPLSEGGEDTLENAGALCPNCHRQAHHG